MLLIIFRILSGSGYAEMNNLQNANKLVIKLPAVSDIQPQKSANLILHFSYNLRKRISSVSLDKVDIINMVKSDPSPPKKFFL